MKEIWHQLTWRISRCVAIWTSTIYMHIIYTCIIVYLGKNLGPLLKVYSKWVTLKTSPNLKEKSGIRDYQRNSKTHMHTVYIYIYLTSTGAGHVDGIVYFALLQDILLHSWSFYLPTMLKIYFYTHDHFTCQLCWSLEGKHLTQRWPVS